MLPADRADDGRRRVPGRQAVALALLASVVLGGCGAADGVEGEHDDADVAFATAMIPHHRQAIVMAEMAAAQASSRQVKEIATQIDAEQVPEIVQMQTMLSTWGGDATAPTIPADPHGMDGMGDASGAGDVAGMMTGAQMTELSAASGPAFDRAFLLLMIRHHEGAVTMAETELADGRDPEALTMAQNIRDAQEAEIALMQRLPDTP